MKKYENYCAALANLKEIYDYEEPYGNVVLAGLVGLYEICFEQSWKAMKEILTYQGVPQGQTGSPRQILKSAYEIGMITDEELWLEALQSRNNVAHAYNREVALDIVRQTKDKYYRMFCSLQTEIEDHWKIKEISIYGDEEKTGDGHEGHPASGDAASGLCDGADQGDV